MASVHLDCSAVDAAVEDVCDSLDNFVVCFRIEQLRGDPSLVGLPNLSQLCSRIVGISAAVDDQGVRSDLEFAAFLGLRAVLLSPSALSADVLRKFVEKHDRPSVWLDYLLDVEGYTAWQLLRGKLLANTVAGADATGSYCRGGSVSVCGRVPVIKDVDQAWSGEHVVACRCSADAFAACEKPLLEAVRMACGAVVVSIRNLDDLDTVSEASPCFDSAAPAENMFARLSGAQLRRAHGAAHAGLSELAASQMATGMTAALNVPQVPLQPLGDQLPSATYEVFERDRPKYDAYLDALRSLCGTLPLAPRVTVYVVGAGRGPLVDVALRAFRATPPSTALKIIALEKNPSAAWFLRSRIVSEDDWALAAAAGRLEVMEGDMRSTAAHVVSCEGEAVVVVSELLGSLGDNELSVECVEGFLAASKLAEAAKANKLKLFVVPRSSTGFVTPVGGSVLPDALYRWNILGRVGRGVAACMSDSFHQMHVIHTRSFHALAAADQSPAAIGIAFKHAFHFEHTFIASESNPSARTTSTADTFERSTEAKFDVRSDGALSGILGTFRSALFGSTSLSTVPDDHTPDMYSWFPIFLPLLFATPGAETVTSSVPVKAGDAITLLLERKRMGDEAVYYCWRVTITREGRPVAQSEHMNGDGRHSVSL